MGTAYSASISYGFRPGRSAHQAVAQAQARIIEGCRFVVDIGLAKFLIPALQLFDI
jgi:retron-type reverse transcriptase